MPGWRLKGIGILAAPLLVLVLHQASAEAPSADDPAQAGWRGHHHGGGRGQGGQGGQGGGGDGGNGDGGVVIGIPLPDSPDGPPPYPPGPSPRPRGIPLPRANAASEPAAPRSWPVWYYCDQPSGYYPYVRVCGHDWQRLPVMPPPPGSGPPIAEASWERCDDPAGYFPYVPQCRRPWAAVTPTTPVPGDDPDGIALIAKWYYCEDARDYLPYAGSCPHVWRTIPAMPPPNVPAAGKTEAQRH